MSPAPALSGSFSDELYAYLAPLARVDESVGWHLAHFVAAFGLPHQLVEDVARDSAEGPGWSALLDIDRCPAWALGWLGQFRGVALLPPAAFETAEEYDAAMRDRIRRADGANRGGADAIAATVERYLTGTRSVLFIERYLGDPYLLAIRTLGHETPDPAGLEAAVRADQKPGGIVLDFGTYEGTTYLAVEAAYPTYAALEAAFDTYDAAEAGES